MRPYRCVRPSLASFYPVVMCQRTWLNSFGLATRSLRLLLAALKVLYLSISMEGKWEGAAYYWLLETYDLSLDPYSLVLENGGTSIHLQVDEPGSQFG